MSDGTSCPPPTPEGNGPPLVPKFHEPPPIGQHEPPPIPIQRHEPPPVPSSAINRPSESPSRRPEVKITERQAEFTPERSRSFGRIFLSWLGLVLSLSCIPIALIGAFWPWLRSPFWLAVLVLSFVAICLEKFVADKPDVSANLVKLSLRLAYGFLFIAVIGLLAAGARASLYISHVVEVASQAVHRTADSWHESNGIIASLLHKVDAIMQFFASHAQTAATASPSPTPTPPPGP